MARDIDLAVAAIAAHEMAGGIEGDDSVQIWHLLVTLRRFSDLQGYDWRELYDDAMQFCAYEGAES